MKALHLALFLVAPLGLLTAQASQHRHAPQLRTAKSVHSTKTQFAVAVLQPTAGNETQGTITFTREGGGIRIKGTIENLSPGEHGFHVHQYGDARKADGTSAGGHFNPSHTQHGAPDAHMRHTGDLGNIVADANGVAEFDFVDYRLSFSGANSILGRGLIVHAGEDDLTSQPTGAAGARVGIAVIGVANPDL